jgi:hypothetical protein
MPGHVKLGKTGEADPDPLPYLGPILQSSVSAERFSDKFSSSNFGQMTAHIKAYRKQ